jgi:sodium/pantothenate symporter
MELAMLIVVIAIFAFYTIFGTYLKKYIKTIDDFYVMGRRAPWYVVGASTIATWFSLWTYMGGFGMAWVWGYGYNPMLWGGVCSPLGIALLAHFIGPRLRRGKFLTIPDYFYERFASSRLRWISALTLIVAIYFYLIGQVIGGGIILEMLAGVPYVIGATLIVVVTIIYLLAGGMFAVFLTDLIGFLFMMVTGLVTVVVCLPIMGGWYGLTHGAEAVYPGQLTSMKYGPGPLWLFSYGLAWVCIAGASPHIINRSLAAKSDKDVVLGVSLGLIVCLTVVVSGFYALAQGLTLFYKKGTIGVDYVWLDFLLKHTPTWFCAFFVAAQAFAAITTINTMIMTMATGIGRDLYHQLFRPKASDKDVMLWTRIGIILTSIAALLLSLPKPWWIVIVTGFAGAVLAAGFFQVLYWSMFTDKLITEKAAFWTMAIGLPISLIIIAGNFFWKWGEPAYPALWSAIYGFLALPILSLVTKKTSAEIDALKKLKAVLERPIEEVREANKPKSSDWAWLIVISALCIALTAYYSYSYLIYGF